MVQSLIRICKTLLFQIKIYSELRTGSLNICGLKKRSNYLDFHDLVRKYDIFCSSETKLGQFDDGKIPGYHLFSKPRKEKYKRKSYGIAFLIKDNFLDHVEILESECEYVYWLLFSPSVNSCGCTLCSSGYF